MEVNKAKKKESNAHVEFLLDSKRQIVFLTPAEIHHTAKLPSAVVGLCQWSSRSEYNNIFRSGQALDMNSYLSQENRKAHLSLGLRDLYNSCLKLQGLP